MTTIDTPAPTSQPRTAAEFFKQQVDAFLDDVDSGEIGEDQSRRYAHELLMQMAMAKQDRTLDFDWSEVEGEVQRLVRFLPPDEVDGWTKTPNVMSFNANQAARRRAKALPFSKLATMSAMRQDLVKLLVTGRERAAGLPLVERKTLAKNVRKSISDFNQVCYLHFPPLAIKGRDKRYLWVIAPGSLG